MLAFVISLSLIALTCFLFFKQKAVTVSPKKKKVKNLNPRVFISNENDDQHEPIKTGQSLVGLLSSNPEKYQTESGGHVISGVLATELDDCSIVLSTSETKHKNIIWKSGFLTLGNTAAWHQCNFVGLPKKYEYCRAAACVLILDDQGHILITRRCKHMRTFPRAWVCPGGGMDDGESLAECAAREVYEETGLIVSANQLKPLTLFESFFPTSPDDVQKQKRVAGQHIVCFFTISIPGHNPKITLQREEANAYAWIPANALDLPGDYEITLFERHSDGENQEGIRKSGNDNLFEVKCPLKHLTTKYDSRDGVRAKGLAEAHLFSINQFAHQRKF